MSNSDKSYHSSTTVIIIADQSAYMPALEPKKETPKGYADSNDQDHKPDKYKQELNFQAFNVQPTSFSTVAAFNLTECCLNVCAIYVGDETIGYTIPFGPPNTPEQNGVVKVSPGIYKAIIDGSAVRHIDDFSFDGIEPWNHENQTSHTDLIGLYRTGDDSFKAVTKKTKDAEHIITSKHSRHFAYPIVRKILSKTTRYQKVPPVGSKVVLVYIVLSEFTYTPKTKSRLIPSMSAEVGHELLSNTPKAVVSIINRNAGFMGNSRPITQKQAEAKARNSPSRNAVTNHGRRKFERSDMIEAGLDEGYFVQARYKTPTDERIFLSNDASLGMFVHSMLPKSTVLNFVRQANHVKTLPKEQRLAALKKLVESKAYQDIQGSATCSSDTTFKLSRLYVTILTFTATELRNARNKPPLQIACIMLSEHRTTADYEWMAQQLLLQLKKLNLNLNSKSAWTFITDGDPALDAFLCIPLFQSPCMRLNCDEHFDQNVSEWCQTDPVILSQFFGTKQNNLRTTGLMDNVDLDEFLEQVDFIAGSSDWKKYPKLMDWAKSHSRKVVAFERHNLLNKVAGGHGLQRATDNGIEGLNQVLKSDRSFKSLMPVQDLIKALQNFVDVELEQVGNALVSTYPYRLRNESLFVGNAIWPTLTVEEKLEHLSSIGLNNTDKIPGFKIKAWDFPKELAPQLSQEERQQMSLSAKNYSVSNVTSESSNFVVTRGDDLAKVFTNQRPVHCTCKLVVGKRVICPHILAVNYHFPEIGVLEKIKDFLEKETRDQRIQRQLTSTAGMKPGTSRRRGDSASRNKTAEIDNILDLTTERPLPGDSTDILSPPAKLRKVTASQERLPRVPQSRPLAIEVSSSASVIQPQQSLPGASQLGPATVMQQRQPSQPPHATVLCPSQYRSANVMQQQQPSTVRVMRPLPPGTVRFLRPHASLQPQQPPPVASQLRPIYQQQSLQSTPHIQQQSPSTTVVRPYLPSAATVPSASKAQRRPSIASFQQELIRLKADNNAVFTAIEHYKGQHPNEVMPNHMNNKPFLITYIKKLPDYKQMRCGHCKRSLGNRAKEVVVVHHEPTTFINAQTNEQQQGTGVVALCVNLICVASRYPYVQHDCFISSLPEEETNATVNIIMGTSV